MSWNGLTVQGYQHISCMPRNIILKLLQQNIARPYLDDASSNMATNGCCDTMQQIKSSKEDMRLTEIGGAGA